MPFVGLFTNRFLPLLGLGLLAGSFSPVQARQAVSRARAASPAVPAASTQDDANVQARQFRDTFTNLSQKYGVVFVMEGVPLRIHDVNPAASESEKEASPEWELPESFAGQQLKRLLDIQAVAAKNNALPQAASPSISSSAVAKPLSLEERVAEAAARYDYAVEKRGIVFLLHKRYTDPRDLPDVTLGESATALKDITRLLSQFNPNVKREFVGVHVGGLASAEASFMASLNDGQRENLQHGGIRVSELGRTQQQDVRQIAMFYYIQIPFEDLYDTMAQFDRLLKKKTVLRQNKQADHWELGYEDPNGWFGGPLFRELDQLPVFTPPFPKPSNDAVKKETFWATQRKAAGATTLGLIVTQINRRSASTPKSVVDVSLADKTITLIGEQKLTPAALMKAVADVCGLRFKTDPDGTPHLTRRNAKQAKTIQELPAAIASAFPEPFLRALHQEDIATNLDEEAELNAKRKAEGILTPATFNRMQELSLRRDVWRKHPEQLGMAAIRKLSVRTQPLFQQNPAARYPIADLDSDTKSAISSIVMMKTMDSLRTVTDVTPPIYIEQWDQLGVMGGKFKNEKDETFYRLYLAVPGSDGKLHTTVGVQTAPAKE